MDSADHTINYRVPETGELVEVQLAVEVLAGTDGVTGYLLSFNRNVREVASAAAREMRVDSDAEGDAATSQEFVELEDELKRTQDHLQAVIEELETSNEELQSLNEELQASTEELQASNEELETTNEELQATNEELSTVNDELQAKSLLLTESNETLNNIQNSLELGIVLVDRDIRIKRFTPSVVRLFGVMEGDIGQRLSRIPTQLELSDLDDLVSTVIREGLPRRREVEHGGVRYLINISPYRTELGAVSGAVLTFAEVSELRESAERLAARETLIRRIGDEAGEAIWWGAVGFVNVIWMNGMIEQITQRSLPALQASPDLLFDWVVPADAKRVRETYRDRSTTGFDISYKLRLPDDSEIQVQDTVAAYVEADGSRTLFGRIRRAD